VQAQFGGRTLRAPTFGPYNVDEAHPVGCVSRYKEFAVLDTPARLAGADASRCHGRFLPVARAHMRARHLPEFDVHCLNLTRTNAQNFIGFQNHLRSGQLDPPTFRRDGAVLFYYLGLI